MHLFLHVIIASVKLKRSLENNIVICPLSDNEGDLIIVLATSTLIYRINLSCRGNYNSFLIFPFLFELRLQLSLLVIRLLSVTSSQNDGCQLQCLKVWSISWNEKYCLNGLLHECVTWHFFNGEFVNGKIKLLRMKEGNELSSYYFL